MSSLKDIMDVDIEPLESQAYRRSTEAAQQQASHPTIAQVSESPSPPIDDSNKGKTPITRRKSNRVSKPVGQSSVARQNLARRRSSAGGDTMDFNSGYQAGGSNQASMSGSPQQSPRGSEPVADLPVKYTPVTGRLSRAKKGVPVHTCDICRPVKTFTRAEHLRRHQLSHQKPAYPCTFEDCERAFHRPDLLARHLHRHETQGEKAYKAGDPRSRASSSASESMTPSLKVETPSLVASTAGPQASPTDSMTPRTSGSDGSSLTASSYSTITSSFQAVNFQGTAGTKRSVDQAQLSAPDTPYPTSSSGTGPSTRPPGSFDHPMSDQGTFGGSQQSFDEPYVEGGMNYTTTPQLPLLRIPEDNWIPGLSYNNSPWCSSASSSTYSTQSDGSRNGPHLSSFDRGRSLSVATLPDWSASATAPYWGAHGMSNTSQDIRSPGFVDSILESYETPFSSPRISTPVSARAQLLNVPTSYEGVYMEPSVGTPTLPRFIKPLAQHFPASTPRFSNNSGLEVLRGKKELVESQQLGSFSLNAAQTFQPQQPSLEIYLSSYWQFFHQLFPIIHQPTFDSTHSDLCTSAMAAIGTQYHDSPEARTKGAELNEFCRKGIELCPSWDLHTMQAILLTEIFTRFRGRKTTVRISRHFEALYVRLLSETEQSQIPMTSQSPATVTSAEALLDRFGPQPNDRVLQHPDGSSDWYQWLEREARQRLLTACFMFDVHQFIYHQQSRSRASRDDIRALICLPCPDSLWNATTPTEEWQAQRSEYRPQPLHSIEQKLSARPEVNTDPFSQSLIICWFAAQLPPREDPRYPNNFVSGNIHPDVQTFMSLFPTSPHTLTYLALYNTPLHSLLAVAGDTWVFAQKITPPSEFQDAQYRLKTWSTSFAAAQATRHACQVLSQVLSQPITLSDGRRNCTLCISDYWSLYVCALICWAFGHKYQNTGNPSLSRSSSDGEITTMSVDTLSLSDDTRLKALNYTSAMLDLSVGDLLTNKATANIKGDTCGVIDAVRHRLEIENVGNKCGHLVDAVGVLGKIKKGMRGKWF